MAHFSCITNREGMVHLCTNADSHPLTHGAQVLDEADRLLESSFAEDLETIFDALPRQRQTLLFSATLTDTLHRLKEIALREPFFWEAPAA